MKADKLRRLTVGPERTCLACRSKLSKAELLRFVVRAGVLVVDKTGRLAGRGAYCCKREECLRKLAARKAGLTKVLRQEVVDCQVVISVCVDKSVCEPGLV